MKHRGASLFLIGIGLSLSACGGGGSSGGAGTINVAWSLKNVDGSAAACAPGYEKMKVTATGYFASSDGTDHDSSNETSALFDCAAGAGTFDVPGMEDYDGRYDLRWEETNSTGDTVYMRDEQSFTGYSVVADVSKPDATEAVTMYPDGGYFWTEWTLYGNVVMNYIDSCAGAAVDRIEVTFTDDTTMAVTTRNYTCDGENNRRGVPLRDLYSVGGAIDPMKAGYYHVGAKAFSGTTEVGMVSSDTNTVTIEDRNKISILDTNLGLDLTTR